MAKIVTIGEAIVDIINKDKENICNAGGAPLNVCAQVKKLGIDALYLSKIGNDEFGIFLFNEIKKIGINTDYVKISNKYHTSLAYVTIDENGDRNFTFKRKNASDMHLSYKDYKNISFSKEDILEFGSVALLTYKLRITHNKLIRKAKKESSLIAFDPNIRLNIWKNHNKLKKIILRYIKSVDILKLSIEELNFIFNLNEQDAIKQIFKNKVSIIFITKGDKGASLYVRKENSNFDTYNNLGYKVKAIDTTGAGDASFGALLYMILKQDFNYEYILDFVCKCGAYACTGYGAIPSYANLDDIEMYFNAEISNIDN